MALFSQRKGLKPVSKTIQLGAMDDELRNRLWSAIHEVVWSKWSAPDFYGFRTPETNAVDILVQALWVNHFKLPSDSLPQFNRGHPKSAYEFVRERYFASDWNEAYDFLEFVVKSAPIPWKQDLVTRLNQYLTEEYAGYRFVGDELVDIVDEHEIAVIETALESGTKESRTHLSNALSKLSDRKNPDYPNSVKEAISAVEAVCKTISGNPKATLKDGLDAMKRNKGVRPGVFLHGAFDAALEKLFGYACDEGGIRHALTEDGSAVSQTDAKFMLATCAAFVNYLWAKAAELGVQPARKV